MDHKRAAMVVVAAGVVAAGVVPVTATSAAAAADDPTKCVTSMLGSMSVEQQVGQLFMMGVSTTAPTSQELSLITSKKLGAVILMGHSSQGVSATRAVATKLQARATGTGGAALTVAIDQEGGNVQVLTGSGFSTMPTALSQGAESPTTLRANAGVWGDQLLDAGITMNLAPVMDTVPESLGTGNKPIGYYHREFGYTTDAVTPHGMAFAGGMGDARVQAAAKHFPGLGRVTDNTDTTFGVADNVTVRDDTYRRPFSTAAAARITAIMISEARYNKIDGQRAVFSHVVMKDMLRGDLGFQGLIISDSMAAAAVRDLTPALRAVDFLLDGGTVVLDTNAADIPPMVDAVVAKAKSDSGFRKTVTDDARLVLTSKYSAGLLSCPADSDPIALHYTEKGGSAVYGEPTASEYRVAGGRARDYTRGTVVWSWRTGVRAVHGSIASKYHSLSGVAGDLGFPVSDEYSTSTGARSDFEHGSISWNRTTGAITVTHG